MRTNQAISINGYAILFLCLVAILFAGIGWYSYQSLENTRANIRNENLDAAKKEIAEAINNFTTQFKILEKDVSKWDELFQQIANPAYFPYWREHRLLNNDIIPKFVTAADVFDRQGKTLAVVNNSVFPQQLDLNNLTPSVDMHMERDHLTLYIPINRNAYGSSDIEGYLGLRFPFLASFIQQSNFRTLNSDSIQFNLTDGQAVSIDDIQQFLKYQLKPNREAESMMFIVQSALFQLGIAVAILCLFFYLLLVFLLSKPLQEVSKYIDQLRLSKLIPLHNSFNFSFPILEIEKIINSLNEYQSQLQKAHGELDQKNQELWEQAHHDPLTGAMNRRAFDNEWSESKQVLRNHRVGLGLLLFDVNHFKAINDTYGHHAGDQVLTTITDILKDQLRKGENLYRIGGDEFAVIIIGSQSADSLSLGNRCIQAVSAFDFDKFGVKEKVRVSCGIAHCQADQLDMLEKLKWQADVAVYQAKRPGNNFAVLFTENMVDGSEAIFSSWINDAVYEATVSGSGIEMHYQPIVNNKTGGTLYFESLLRIRHDDELIPPSNIFSIISSRNLETNIDQMIIKSIQHDLENNLVEKQTGVSINLSAESVADPNMPIWFEGLKAYLEDYQLVIEVTETSLISHMNMAVTNLEALREAGFKVALDDFGSGYSSLRYLTSMPVDTIKFDISLIQGMQQPRLGKLVEELANLLSSLDFDLVAEGIETKEMHEAVLKAGFDACQGFYFGKPSRKKTDL